MSIIIRRVELRKSGELGDLEVDDRAQPDGLVHAQFVALVLEEFAPGAVDRGGVPAIAYLPLVLLEPDLGLKVVVGDCGVREVYVCVQAHRHQLLLGCENIREVVIFQFETDLQIGEFECSTPLHFDCLLRHKLTLQFIFEFKQLDHFTIILLVDPIRVIHINEHPDHLHLVLLPRQTIHLVLFELLPACDLHECPIAGVLVGEVVPVEVAGVLEDYLYGVVGQAGQWVV